jgi:hypothetical protein
VQAGHRSGRVERLLELDPELGEDLGEEEAQSAGADLLVRVETLGWERHSGRWGPTDGRGFFGFLVTEGVLVREVELSRGSSSELLGVGDLLRPWDVDGAEIMPHGGATVCWTVLRPVALAVLDPRFVERACRWPSVLARLAGRGVLRAKAVTLNHAISHLKHVESRLLLLFLHIAERWGRVGPEGITIEVPLTHEQLGRLVGATRPSVTTALGRLSRRGLVERLDETWRLAREAQDRVEDLGEPGVDARTPPSAG